MKKNFLRSLSKAFLFTSIFLIPFYFFRFSLLNIPTNVYEIAVLFSLVFFCCFSFLEHSKIKFGSVWPYLFLFVVFISALFSIDKVNAFGIFKGWFLVPVIFYFLIINLFNREEVSKLSVPVYLSLAVISVWSYLQSLGIFGLLFYQKNDPSLLGYLSKENFRLLGPFESPNYLAMFLVPALFLALPILTYLKSGKKPFYYLGLIPFGLAVFDLCMTGSRGGILAFSLAFLALLVAKFKHLKGQAKKITLSLAIVFVLLVGFVLGGQTFGGRSGSDSSRMSIYNYSLELIYKNPFLGIGLGDFQTKIKDISLSDSAFQTQTLPFALHPHNLFLALWLNVGLAGLVLFLIIIINLFLRLKKEGTVISVILFSSMLAILAQGLFDTTYFKNDLAALFWLIIALSVLQNEKSLSEN